MRPKIQRNIQVNWELKHAKYKQMACAKVQEEEKIFLTQKRNYILVVELKYMYIYFLLYYRMEHVSL